MTSEEQVWISNGPEETRSLGVQLAAILEPGDLLAFWGDLGSGKTCMIQGICQGLQVVDYVTSPTFMLINEYTGWLRGSRISIYHFDLYRLKTQEELEDLGAEEYFYNRGICCVEWANRAGDLLPSRRHDLILEHLAESARRIVLRTTDP